MKAITRFQSAVLLVALTAGIAAAGMTMPGVTAARAANAGCTPLGLPGHPTSQTLGKTEGVICPPDIDPSMKKAAPGTEGGNRGVQPK